MASSLADGRLAVRVWCSVQGQEAVGRGGSVASRSQVMVVIVEWLLLLRMNLVHFEIYSDKILIIDSGYE